MEYVGKLGSLFTSVQSFYNEINPATLSGAIDIVVVEQPDGELACSPFHVRFGKLSVLMPQEKKVQIKVNGEVVPYVMKVGEAGEAFFVFETEHEVPKEFQTSPIMEAVSEKSDEEPPYLDIGESKDSVKETKSSNEDHFEEDEEDDKNKALLPAELQSPKMIIDEQMDKVVTKIRKEDQQPDISTPKNDAYLMEDGSTLLERVIPEAITTTTVAKERFIVRPAQGDIYSTYMDVIHTSVHKRNNDESDKEHVDSGHNNSNRGDESIVLDIAGYKTGEDSQGNDDINKKEREEIQKLSEIAAVVREIKQEEEKEEEEEKMKKQEEEREIERDQVTEDVNEKVDSSQEEILELTPGQRYRIEMSLCGFSQFTKDEKENKRIFDKEMITYDNFTHNPNILNDKRLVFRYNGKYYSAGRTGPLFTSLVMYTDEQVSEQEEQKVSDSRESYLFGRGWRQWLSRSSVAAEEKKNNEKKEEQDESNVDSSNSNQQNSSNSSSSSTTFTTTMTTTSVGWKSDHTHPEEEVQENVISRKVYAKTLRLTSEQLKSLNLKRGANTITFSVTSAYQGTATCAAKVFYWRHDYQIVISDIDGTITKSDALGHVFTMIGKDWTHMGIAKLYTDIANNGYHFLYLTSRAIGQADYTRDYLKKVVQDKYQLPDGPVIMSPDRLFTSFHREVIMRKPEVFKMACLKDIQRLFDGKDPFYAGFGNRITDARSYRSVNVPSSRIFTIDPYGDLKLELLSGFKSSYIHLNDLVDQIFPPITKNTGSNSIVLNNYNDWNYWKSPLPDIDDIPELSQPVPTSPKPKPIKPDPSALPPNTVVSSNSTSTTRRLLRSFTSASSSNSKANAKLLQSSNSTPNLTTKSTELTDPVNMNITTTTNVNTAINAVPSATVNNTNTTTAISTNTNNSTAINTTGNSTPTSIESTSPSIMNKMLSSVSRTFLSSNESRPKEQAEEVEQEEEKDVDELLDNLNMDEIPFI
ncbi:Putative Lipin Ned1 [Rhizopus microsporus]|nr:Putative Lipin Ned1 [Rhizopus microsporus]